MNGWKMLALWTTGAALIALAAGWSAVVLWTNANSGLASWVQAVFSVLAILATSGVVLWQHELERKRQKEADVESRRRRHSVVVALAHVTSTHAAWLRKKLPDRAALMDIKNKNVYFEMEDIARIAARIEAVPLHELDDAIMARDLLLLTESCLSLKRLLSAGIADANRLNSTEYEDFFRAFDGEVESCRVSYEKVKVRAKQLAAGTHVTVIP
ncbi:hypothetical protein J2W28_001052 [Variovorax boronicumulans]|uniref:hypothetical protein n=1 Tax=Variovorax boronicumulans TaxID=436515 RepID=UPI002786DEC0|nr:hypothetical protein [Variovorax boronicumulans]MDP9992024.1 hypothetical protein [Variovorax boronicumulans]MDQ0001919.1 hypothetical protein [Variovorax boronicumulans]